MNDLVQFLHDQLGEDERIARAVTTPGTWRVGGSHGGPTVEGDGWTVCSADELDGAHIAAHDPARALREIDAKRQLIARGGPFCTSSCDAPGNEPMDPDTNWKTPLEHHLDCAAYQAAGVLAVVYADRPGFREEWRP